MKKLTNELSPFGLILAAGFSLFDWRIAALVLLITYLIHFLTGE
jgi:hypothetical protein